LRETWLKPPPGENVVRGSLIAVLSIKSTFIDPIWKGPGCFYQFKSNAAQLRDVQTRALGVQLAIL